VHRITSQRIDERLKQPRDLGETMVIAHAVTAAQQGADVVVLIDDGRGAQIATSEIRRLSRMRAGGQTVGMITLVSTVTVLAKAAGTQHIPDRGEMREVYRRLRGLDDYRLLRRPTCWTHHSGGHESSKASRRVLIRSRSSTECTSAATTTKGFPVVGGDAVGDVDQVGGA
jgi:hypothetical protein